MAARIYPAAKARIHEVWDYTERTWGEEQADKYVRELVAAIQRASEARHTWRRVPGQAGTAVFFIRHAHHYVFFREIGTGVIGVISVLHESMDLPARLREDAERDEIQ